MTTMPTLRVKRIRVLAALANPRADRETAGDHIRKVIQTLEDLADLWSLAEEDRKDVRVLMRRLWLALREMERGNA